MKFKRKKQSDSPIIKTWEEGRVWLKKKGWLFHLYESEYNKGVISFSAEKISPFGGIRVEIKSEAKTDLAGIKSLIVLAQGL